MSQIISIQTKSEYIDVSREFYNYKYAIQEHQPIKLSNGNWLHSYKVTKYNDRDAHGDQDVEQEAFEREIF